MEEGISRTRIPGGVRAMQALGVIGVRRSPRKKGCKQYEQNRYWLGDGWLRFEPLTASKASKAAALDHARTVARAARNGGEDISIDAGQRTGKTETETSDIRVSEVSPRGVNSGTESYVVKDIALKVRDSDRPTLSTKYTSGGGGSGAAPPTRDACDPGPMSEDSYGYDPAAPIHSAGPPSAGGVFEVCGYACRDGCIAPMRHQRNAMTGAMGPSAPEARVPPTATPAISAAALEHQKAENEAKAAHRRRAAQNNDLTVRGHTDE